jgi:hypothetical protein
LPGKNCGLTEFIYKANAVEIIFKNGRNKIKYESVLQQATSFDDCETLYGKRFQRNTITVSKWTGRKRTRDFFKFCLRN